MIIENLRKICSRGFSIIFYCFLHYVNISTKTNQSIFSFAPVHRLFASFHSVPVITDFTEKNSKGCMRNMIQENYNRIKEEVKQIVKDKLARIGNDEILRYLLKKL